jgi:predicted transcriptional regulator with HTH domain
MTKTTYEIEFKLCLRKSKARRLVLTYLADIYPRRSYPSEIAREIGLGVNEVFGALNGVRNRYKKEYSLVNLNLVKKEKRNRIYLYSATDLGCDVYRTLIK